MQEPEATGRAPAVVRGGRRGRPAGFDRDEVLDALVELFWERGYDGVTHQDIRARTGLSGSSLHHAFGDKPEIFDLALARYHQRASALADQLATGRRGLADLLDYAGMMERTVRSGAPAGCLMITSGAQPVGRLPAVRSRTASYREQWRRAFLAAVHRATSRGEISAGDPEGRAWLLLAAHTGVMIAAAQDPGGPGARAMAAGLRALVAGWAVPTGPGGGAEGV